VSFTNRSHRLNEALKLNRTASQTGFTSGHQELDTALSKNSLLHGETLFVATSHDLEDIPLELISELVTADLLGQPLVVELTTEPEETY
jgi:hypothetical protein